MTVVISEDPFTYLLSTSSLPEIGIDIFTNIILTQVHNKVLISRGEKKEQKNLDEENPDTRFGRTCTNINIGKRI